MVSRSESRFLLTVGVPPRDVRRLHFLGGLESWQVVRRGGIRRSYGSGRCGWSLGSAVSTIRSGRRSVRSLVCSGLCRDGAQMGRQAQVDRRPYTVDGFKLGKWVATQQGSHGKGALDADRQRRLEELPGWTWKASSAQ